MEALVLQRQIPPAGPQMLKPGWSCGGLEVFSVLQGWRVKLGWAGEMLKLALVPLREVTQLLVVPQVPEPTLVPWVLDLCSLLEAENLRSPCRGQINDAE